jgi:hypothetical protein
MTTIVRRAMPKDIEAIVDLAVESVMRDPLPVKINRDAMAASATECMGPAHFNWVAETDGKVVAAVIAHVSPGFWFHKLQASVLMYYTRVPGAGAPLLREFARWVKGRSGIKLAIFELEPNADPRLVRFLKRLGFERQSQNLCYVRSLT